ncbi:marine proteobacterial sortase target protein [Thalassotalea sp. M1531]|uniref:Marine proteobacterial sortase target protein n=1 Tax=Thalassotalea algicola TaxID=2716224 RepID=A0A7Y0Q6J1_9GAMM|nr:marine proteobacterial sortase target protein [Thalassotalea algicola]NMP30020.1 marine proteobacterial sortase target protein [Thalassotalea algicola]
MINTKKNLQLLDYQGSYFYQKQRQKKRKIKLLVVILLLLFVALPLFLVNKVNAESSVKHVGNNPYQHGPQLSFNHPNPEMRMAVPVDMEANVEINGLIAYTELKQVFLNPHSLSLEGRYQFPLPENAAVNYLKVEIGDRVIEGKIMEKKAAKVAYQKAKRAGKKASLVQQQRPNLFTNNIANIPANSAVVVTIKFITPISYEQGKFGLNLPLAMTQRYVPTSYQKSPAELDTELLPPLAKALAKSQASININLNAGLPITLVSSDSHAIKTSALDSSNSQFLIRLDKQQAIADRSFVLNWQLSDSHLPQVANFTEQVNNDYYTLLTLFPPQSTDNSVRHNELARDIIFVIDTSGSMQGQSIAQAKASLKQALQLLTSKDSFNVIAFDSASEQLFSQTEMVSDASINRAKHFIERLTADGGTEMYRPLSQALMMSTASDQVEKAIRQIVFITDGAVANEFELMKLLNNGKGNYRLFTVGIGAAPNGYFMKKAAQFGRGSYVFIQDTRQVKEAIALLMDRISQPAVTNVQLMFDKQVHDQLDIYPKQIPDLYHGKPLQVVVKSKIPINSVQVLGDMANVAWYRQLIIDENNTANSVSTLWARQKIEDLMDSLVAGAEPKLVKEQVINTSIAHQIISPYTSFIALEQAPATRSLFAANNASKSKMAQISESLSVAMPKTALGWQQQLLISILVLLISRLVIVYLGRKHG